MRKGGNCEGRRLSKHSNDKKSYRNKEKSKGKDIVCYECRKLGHIRLDYPSIEKEMKSAMWRTIEKKKKALKVETWNDIDCESSDENEANIYHMADLEHEVKDSKLSYEELQNFLREMFEEHQKALKGFLS